VNFFQEYWKEILEMILAAIGVGFVFKISIKRKSDLNKVTQNGNKVMGDQAGRDINK